MKEEIEKYIITELEIDDAETIAMLVSSYGDSLNENYAIIQAAIAAGDGSRGGAAAHALKGASANIGAQAGLRGRPGPGEAPEGRRRPGRGRGVAGQTGRAS